MNNQDKLLNSEFDIVWERIIKNQGETFYTISGLELIYKVENDTLTHNRSTFVIPKTLLKKVYLQTPIKSLSQLKHLRAYSYLYAILTDERICN